MYRLHTGIPHTVSWLVHVHLVPAVLQSPMIRNFWLLIISVFLRQLSSVKNLSVVLLVFWVTGCSLLVRLMSILMLLMVVNRMMIFSKPWRVCRLVVGVLWTLLRSMMVVWVLPLEVHQLPLLRSSIHRRLTCSSRSSRTFVSL